MSRLAQINLVLIFLLAVIFIWLWQTPSELQETIPLTRIDANSITTIKIESPTGLLHLQKKQQQWWIKENEKLTPADSQRVDQLLKITATHSFRQFAATKDNQINFGLKEPVYSLQLNEHKLLFGHTDPVNFDRYVLTENKIHLIGDGFLHHLQAGIKGFKQPQTKSI